MRNIDELIQQTEVFNAACRKVVWRLMSHRYARNDGSYNWEGIQSQSKELQALLEAAWTARPEVYDSDSLQQLVAMERTRILEEIGPKVAAKVQEIIDAIDTPDA